MVFYYGNLVDYKTFGKSLNLTEPHFFHTFNRNVNTCKNQRLLFRKTISPVSGTYLVLNYYV